jgi:chemotaxis protein methyltransferase CheR
MREADAERIEIDLLLEGALRRYGYDFRHYSFASLKRRLEHARQEARLTRFSEMLDPLLHDARFFDSLLKILSVTVTEMFRDPPYYQAVRENIAPILKTYPFVKIWHAGCATGEEVYSMAIMLHEEGLLDRARLYATDFNKHSLDAAESGVYAAKAMAAFEDNYRAAGGKAALSDYFTARYDFAKMKDFLRERITFSYHNLVTDGVFGEMNLISCRNVLIYFDKTLQNRVLSLFADSLRHGGFLCLGSKETLKFSTVQHLFEAVDAKQRVYKKTGMAHV